MAEQRENSVDKNPQSRIVPGTALLHKLFILLELVASGRGVTIKDLAKQTRWPRATLYRIVGAATGQGYLHVDPITNHYTLGFRFVELAQNVWSSGDLITIAALELRRLRDISGETAHLGVLRDMHVVAMGKYETPHPYRDSARLGQHKPLHSTSQGKAILAFLPEGERDDIISRLNFRRSTAHSITDPDILRSQLRIVRQRGYSVDDEEAAIGTRCVGAPILNSAGRPVAAISIAGPTYRVTTDRVERLGPEVAQVAHHIGSMVRDGTAVPSEPEQGPSVVPVSDLPALDGVSPSWDEAGVLHWGDRLAPRVHSTRGATQSFRFDSDLPINVVSHGDGVVAAYGDGWLFGIGRGGHMLERRAEGLRRLSALAVRPDGIPFGAMLHEGQGISIIGRLLPLGTMEESWQLLGDVSDLAWSASGKLLYAAVPGRGLIYSLSDDSAPRILARISKASGEPRGLAVDAEGRLWVSLYDGWSVARLTTEGEIERVIALPVPRPTGLAFGGGNGGSIYVTTARIDLPRDVLENAPLSGRLLLAETGVPGYIPPAMRYVPGLES